MSTETIRLIEELAANAWRPAIEQQLGGWRLRWTGGESRRVNSVWPNRLPAVKDLAQGIEQVEDFYRLYNAIPRHQICPAALPEDLPDRLAERGYTAHAHTAVKIADIKDLLKLASPAKAEMTASPQLSETWFQTYTGASGYSSESLPIRLGILTRVEPTTHFVTLSLDGTPVAVGLGVVERGWMGVFCVVTDPAHLRQGLASGVMYALAEWGQAQGAEQVYLQVMNNNPPAIQLYERMGFEELYEYSYYELRDA